MAKSKTGKNLEDAEVAVANVLKKFRDGDYSSSESRVIEKYAAMFKNGEALKYTSAGDGKPLELMGGQVLALAKLSSVGWTQPRNRLLSLKKATSKQHRRQTPPQPYLGYLPAKSTSK